ncbi:MAG: hypothetical protein BJ554DRAFT_4228, partial [Olpidium bornovanus]
AKAGALRLFDLPALPPAARRSLPPARAAHRASPPAPRRPSPRHPPAARTSPAARCPPRPQPLERERHGGAPSAQGSQQESRHSAHPPPLPSPYRRPPLPPMGTEETAPLAPTCSLAAGHLAGDRGKNCYSSRDEWGDSSSSTSASASTSSTPQTSAAGTDVGPGSVRPPPAPRLAVSRAVAPAHGVDLLRGDKFTPQTFPPELLGICFAFLGFLRVDLVACALVCRNWLVPALQQLYRSPWFRTRNAARKFADLVAAAKQGHTALEYVEDDVRGELCVACTERAFDGHPADRTARVVDKFVKVLNFEHEACEKLLWDADHVNKALNACENITHLRMGGLGRRPVWYHPPAYIFDVAVLRRNLRVVQYNDNCVDVSIGMQRIVRLLSNLPNLQKLSVYGELSSDNGFHHLATLPGTLPEDVEIPVLSNPHQSLHSLSLKAEYFADAFVTKLLPFLPNLIRVRFGSLVHQRTTRCFIFHASRHFSALNRYVHWSSTAVMSVL